MNDMQTRDLRSESVNLVSFECEKYFITPAVLLQQRCEKYFALLRPFQFSYPQSEDRKKTGFWILPLREGQDQGTGLLRV